MLDQFIYEEQIRPQDQDELLRVLLLKHRCPCLPTPGLHSQELPPQSICPGLSLGIQSPTPTPTFLPGWLLPLSDSS